MFYCLQCSIDHLELSRVLCNRPSWLFRCHPNASWHPYAPIGPLDAPLPPLPPVQESSGQDWYSCRSAWHLVSLWVRLMFGQMYSSPHHPYAPLMPPQVEASGGQEWYELVSHSPDLMFYCLQCSVDPLEFSRVHPHPQCRHLVLKNGTTVGQHDIWAHCGLGWSLVRCTPPPLCPLSAPPLPQCRHLVPRAVLHQVRLTFGQPLGQLNLFMWG